MDEEEKISIMLKEFRIIISSLWWRGRRGFMENFGKKLETLSQENARLKKENSTMKMQIRRTRGEL